MVFYKVNNGKSIMWYYPSKNIEEIQRVLLFIESMNIFIYNSYVIYRALRQ